MFNDTGIHHPFVITVFVVLGIWVLFWKGYSLWTAARMTHRRWFIVLCIFNTFGILDIYYIFCIAKKTGKDIRKSLKVKI